MDFKIIKTRKMKSEEQIFSYINISEFNNIEIFFVEIFKCDFIFKFRIYRLFIYFSYYIFLI